MAEKRGNKWMESVYHPSLPKGRVRRSFDSQREAEAWKLDSKARLMRGEPVLLGEGASRDVNLPYTLHELRNRVLADRWSQTRGVKTHAINSLSIINAIGPNTAIKSVTRAHIDKARKALLDGGNEPITVNKKVSTLKVMLDTAKALGVISEVPAFPAKYEERQGRQGRFTEEDESRALRFFEVIGHPLMADYVAFSVDTGLRQGEILLITGREYDGKRITCWGEWTKTGKTRHVPLTARAKAIVERLIAMRGSLKLPLFGRSGPLPKGDRSCLSKDSIHHYWQLLREQVGKVDDASWTPHLMRHEFCSRLADRGVNGPTIQTLAGHGNPTTTQRYIRVSEDALEAAVVAPVAPDVTTLLAQLKAAGVDLSKIMELTR